MLKSDKEDNFRCANVPNKEYLLNSDKWSKYTRDSE